MRVLRVDSAVLWGDGAEAGVVVNQKRKPLTADHWVTVFRTRRGLGMMGQ